MSKELKTKKTVPRMFYGVNAAAYLTLVEITGRISYQVARVSEGHGTAAEVGQIGTRGEIQRVFIHYLRFIRALTESEV
jgi:hypothetical protein